MDKLNCYDAIKFWQANDEAKQGLDRNADPQGLAFGLYDDFPVWLNSYYAFFQNLVVNQFLKQIPLSHNTRILEIGCGSGRWCSKLSLQSALLVCGVDIGFHILKSSRRRYEGNAAFVNALAARLPFRNASLDLVFSVTVLHHLPPERQEAALDEVSRVLKPGGSFFMLESSDINTTSNHLYGREFEQWRLLLQRHNFQILDSRGQGYIDFRYVIRPLRRYIKKWADKIAVRSENTSQAVAGQTVTGNSAMVNTAGLSMAERVFHLAFLPLVLLAYPVELCFHLRGSTHRAGHACFLARRER